MLVYTSSYSYGVTTYLKKNKNNKLPDNMALTFRTEQDQTEINSLMQMMIKGLYDTSLSMH